MATGTLTLAWLLSAVCALPADVEPMNQRNFKIPIRFDEARRSEIKQLLLFQSTDQGKQWNQVGLATPDKDGFPFFAETDGPFWFSVVVVYQQGKREPEDLLKAPPGMKILVDTVKPVVKIVAAERQGDDLQVAWEVQEANLDPASLALEYRPADAPEFALWTAVPITAAASGQARFRLNNTSPVIVRLTAQDLASNQSSDQKQVAAAPVTTVSNHASAVSGGVSGLQNVLPPPSSVPPLTTPPSIKPATSGTASGSPFEIPPPSSAATSGQTNPWGSKEQTASPASAPRPFSATSNSSQGGIQRVVATSDPQAEPVAPAVNSGGSPLPRGNGPAAQVVNETHLNLEYEVIRHGPSGVGSVDLWVTQDDGRTWRFLTNDTDLKPPITFDLPHGDAVYGFRLVIQSGAGQSKGPPLAGDPPDLRIEVDTTPPVVQLFEPKADRSRRDYLLVSWGAQDRNLTPTPIALEWGDPATGTWNVIAAGLPNTGYYNWQLPPRLPYRVHLRVTARDAAGNAAVAETTEPILVDLTKPEGRIIGISAARRTP